MHHANILKQGLKHTHDSESDGAGDDNGGWTEIMLARKGPKKVHDFPNIRRREIDPCMAGIDEFAEWKSRISFFNRQVFAHIRCRDCSFNYRCYQASLQIDAVTDA